MKETVNRIVIALLLVIFASAPAFAKVHTANITLKADTKVGDVVVKKGDYDVKFDDQTSEITIRKGRKVIATSAVSLEALPKKFPDTAIIVKLENNEPRLTGIIFSGTNQTVLLTGNQAAAKQ